MDIQREIDVIEALLKMLNAALIVSIKNRNLKHAQLTVLDIVRCKKELQRLIEKREAALKGEGNTCENLTI